MTSLLLNQAEVGVSASDQDRVTGNPGRQLYTTDQWDRLSEWLGLSPREVEVLYGVFDDLSEPALAAYLGLSEHTVHTYLKRLYQKLGVRSRVGVVCRVVAVERELASRNRPDGEADRRVPPLGLG